MELYMLYGALSALIGIIIGEIYIYLKIKSLLPKEDMDEVCEETEKAVNNKIKY